MRRPRAAAKAQEPRIQGGRAAGVRFAGEAGRAAGWEKPGVEWYAARTWIESSIPGEARPTCIP
eukprot:scaffold27386_cov112-Isochrysis_galbana.AAC.3